MPHVIVKLWPGKTVEQKRELAERISAEVCRVLDARDASVSISFEEIEPARWKERVYDPDIAAKPDQLVKAPGYSM